MEPVSALVVVFAFAGAKVAHKMADAAVDTFWKKGSEIFRRMFGGAPEPAALTPSRANAITAADPSLVSDANALLQQSSALRRAQRSAKELAGTQILWIDDHPENNVWERLALSNLGVQFLTVERTQSAEASLRAGHFDLIISDIARDNGDEDGLSGLARLKVVAPVTPVVFYVGALQRESRPPGAFGITNDPEELFHLILDIVDRTRL